MNVNQTEYFSQTGSMQSRRELLLLLLAFIFIAASYLALSIAPAVRKAEWEAAGFHSAFAIGLTLWSVSAYLGHFTLNRKAPFRDPFLFPVAMFLVGWGLVLIQRLAPGFGVRQSLWLFIGTLVLVGVLFAPPDLRWLRRFPYLWLTSGLLLTALTLIVGTNPSGEDLASGLDAAVPAHRVVDFIYNPLKFSNYYWLFIWRPISPKKAA